MSRRLPVEIKEKIVQDFKSGKVTSTVLLAKKYGCSRHTVYRTLKKAGFTIESHRMLSPPSIKLPKEEWKLAYFAGLVDGEGQVLLVKDKHRKLSKTYRGLIPRICIDNTSKELMEWIVKNFWALL